MTQPEREDQGGLSDNVQKLHETERKNRLKWSLIAGSITLAGIGLFVLFAEQREFFFRPKPDMDVVEKAAFDKSNDPACRELLSTIDEQEKHWKEVRAEMKDALASEDIAALSKAQKTVGDMITVYEKEQRRLEIVILNGQLYFDAETGKTRVVDESELRGDISRYIRHVLTYLRRMRDLLDTRVAELKQPAEPEVADADAGPDAAGSDAADSDAADSDADGKEVAELDRDAGTATLPGVGEVELAKPDKKPQKDPTERWSTAWSAITEDHDKWRVFRQAPIPCGRRTGEVPPLPDKVRDIESLGK